ncbi:MULTISPECIES: helix-turn-helix domain-containing protein [Microbacterium]|jgi:transcriptional regulator with XRE-family HTH domain|uniref:Helix-turn-helix domain-containing protein n=1 Tax=Microbacterium mcarthurae TaxID=3035918 RepID=A0ABW9GDD5_9MICO|nr:helix-turn-helix domain-containing protein [Microbacterium sp. ACRRU]MCG7416520.1 helix-turn-helix domain-containing protein [Microbacterium sp. ACRRU]
MTDDIGQRLRDARLQRGMSLRSVASSLGVSASLISQVETGKTQPSVSTLYAIVTHLGISIDELLGVSATAPTETTVPSPAPTSSDPTVQHAADNAVLDMENGVRWERLAAGAGPADALLVTYQPGASSSVEGKMMRHAGMEYAYLLEGELTLRLEFDTFTLRPGDSLHFDSIRPHLYVNQSDQIARGIWFVVGRREHNQAMPSAGQLGTPRETIESAVDVLRAMDDLGR